MTTTHQKTAHLTDIDPAYFDVRLDDDALSSSHIEALESGVTPVHRQNIDEQRIDELLVEEGIHEDHYPTTLDIADPDAANDSYKL
jgi:hypothetical protein